MIENGGETEGGAEATWPPADPHQIHVLQRAELALWEAESDLWIYAWNVDRGLDKALDHVRAALREVSNKIQTILGTGGLKK